MTPYTIFSIADGRIRHIYASDDDADLHLNTPNDCGCIEGGFSGETHYIDTSGAAPKAVPRPSVPTLAGGSAPHHLDLSEIPPGSDVTIENEAGDAVSVADLAAGVTLADPGRYRVRVDPPFPAIPLDQTIEVA